MSRVARCAFAALIVLAPLACSRTEANSPLGFALLRTTGSELPTLLRTDEGEDQVCRYALTGGEIELADTAYTSELVITRSCLGAEMVLDTLRSPGTGYYRVEGDSLLFFHASGQPSGQGLLAGDTLTLAGPSHTLVFLREDQP